jgi:hypothetical protein
MMTLIVSLLFFFVTASAEAATYYVKKTGSDSNNCTAAQTEGTPKLTISSALACFAAGTAGSGAGHTVRVYVGTYAERLDNNIPGGTSWSSPFTLEVNPGDTVTIDPSGCGRAPIFMARAAQKFILINGSSTWAPGDTGTGRLIIDSDGCTSTVQDNIRFNADTTTGTGPNNVRVQGVEVRDASNNGIFSCPTCDRLQFTRIWAHHNGSTATVDDTHGVYLRGPDVIVENGLFENNFHRGIQIRASTATTANAIVRNNIIRNNSTVGAGLSGNVSLSAGSNHQFYGNFVGPGTQDGVRLTCSGGCANNASIYNNTIYDNDSAAVFFTSDGTITGAMVKNNIWRSNGSTITLGGSSGTTQSNNLSTDPSFINAAGGNFCLQAGSSAINAGTASIRTGITRVYNGTAPDIGACETLPATIAAGITANADDSQHVDITFPMNLATPLLPATGVTNFTLSDSRTVTSAVKLSDSVIRLTYTGTCTAGTFSYAQGNLTDSALIGGSVNQPVFAITTQAITNNCGGGAGTAELAQVSFRFYRLLVDPDGDLIGTGAVNASIRAASGQVFTVEIQTDCTEEDCAALGQILQYDVDGAGSWTTITDECTGTKLCFYGAGNTDPMLPSGVPTCPLSGAFTCVDGGTQRVAAAVPAVDLAQDNSVVNRYLLKAQAAVDEVLRLRLINQTGAVLTSYDQYPTITGRNAAGFR